MSDRPWPLITFHPSPFLSISSSESRPFYPSRLLWSRAVKSILEIQPVSSLHPFKSQHIGAAALPLSHHHAHVGIGEVTGDGRGGALTPSASLSSSAVFMSCSSSKDVTPSFKLVQFGNVMQAGDAVRRKKKKSQTIWKDEILCLIQEVGSVQGLENVSGRWCGGHGRNLGAEGMKDKCRMTRADWLHTRILYECEHMHSDCRCGGRAGVRSGFKLISLWSNTNILCIIFPEADMHRSGNAVALLSLLPKPFTASVYEPETVTQWLSASVNTKLNTKFSSCYLNILCLK